MSLLVRGGGDIFSFLEVEIGRREFEREGRIPVSFDGEILSIASFLGSFRGKLFWGRVFCSIVILRT